MLQSFNCNITLSRKLELYLVYFVKYVFIFHKFVECWNNTFDEIAFISRTYIVMENFMYWPKINASLCVIHYLHKEAVYCAKLNF